MKFQRVFALVAGLVLAIAMNQPAVAQAVGEKAKLNHVVTFDGKRLDVADIEGKPTLVYFWASWCPICRTEMPVLEKHYQAFKDKDFRIVAINFRDEERLARQMIARIQPISYTVGLINDEWRNDYPNLQGTPTWLLLDRRGVIRKMVVGQQVITGGWFDGLEGELRKVTSD